MRKKPKLPRGTLPSRDRTMSVDLPWHTGRKICGRRGWAHTATTLASIRWGLASSSRLNSCLSCFTASRGKLLSPTWTEQQEDGAEPRRGQAPPTSHPTRGRTSAHLDLHGCRSAVQTQQQGEQDAGGSHVQMMKMFSLRSHSTSALPALWPPLIGRRASEQRVIY